MEETNSPQLDFEPNLAENPRAIRHRTGRSFRIFRGTSISLELPEEVSKILNSLMNRTSHDAEEVFIKALFLYKAAIDAEHSGKRMVILDGDGDIDQEITGL